MKKLACIALVGLTCFAVSSFADYPPPPAPGVSCKTDYNPSTDLTKFCGCYQQQAVEQCQLLASHGHVPGGSRVCNLPFSILVNQTCDQVSNERSIQNFCKTNVDNLHKSGDSTVTEQNCIDDVGYICNEGGSTSCKPWQ